MMDKQHNPVITLASLLTGNELALLDCLLFLHDKGLIDKEELATRLDATANRMAPEIVAAGNDAQTMLHPIRRLATGLRSSIKIGDQK